MKPIVTIDDFLKTYNNGLKIFEKYQRAMELVNQNIKLQRIIDQLGISRKTLYKWRKENAKPDSLRGLEMVQRIGWVPLTYSSKNFLMINRIAAWVLSGGSIHNPFYRVVLSGDPSDLERIKKDVEELGLEPMIREGRDSRGPSLDIGEKGASQLGRVIHCLGVPKGEKAQSVFSKLSFLVKRRRLFTKN